MSHEYEMISYKNVNFKFSVVNCLYRTPHIHKEFEICLLLDGKVQVNSGKKSIIVNSGEIYLSNPYQSHEILSLIPESPAMVVNLQLPFSYFKPCFPKMELVRFTFQTCSSKLIEHYSDIREQLLHIAKIYFKQDWDFGLKCAGLIYLLFSDLLKYFPYKLLTEQEKRTSDAAAVRMDQIVKYISQNYDRKLLLTEIAEQEGLSMNYLSHLFRDFFGLSFQEYLLRLRCEKAQQLLFTDLSLYDISVSCGFSDPKYFNQGFRKIYGCTPKQYKKNLHSLEPSEKIVMTKTRQRFFSAQESLAYIEQIST